MTVIEYANFHKKTTQAVYQLIKQGRIMTDVIDNHTVILPDTPWPTPRKCGRPVKVRETPLPSGDPSVKAHPSTSGGVLGAHQDGAEAPHA